MQNRFNSLQSYVTQNKYINIPKLTTHNNTHNNNITREGEEKRTDRSEPKTETKELEARSITPHVDTEDKRLHLNNQSESTNHNDPPIKQRDTQYNNHRVTHLPSEDFH